GLPRLPAARAAWNEAAAAPGEAAAVNPQLQAAGDESASYHPIPDMDVEDMRRLFAEQEWRPDMLKIYPTLVVMEGETPLKAWWKKGKFQALDTAAAKDVVVRSFPFIPEYCRIQRIDRDIPTTHVEAGVMNSNLRQMAEEEADRKGIDVREIRRREVSRRIRDGVNVDPARLTLVRRDYQASNGLETFLSFEDPEADAIVGFIRLRRVGPNPHRPEFQHENGTAVVRELKVYGVAQAIGEHDDAAWQHQGLGKRLLEAAEAVASGWGVGRILVIAGVGVKQYYRNQGYQDLGPYVAKEPKEANA
ncbi:MAG: GNAT family N-acetyltransferase, partial [Thermoplasmatota archaeon]